MNEPSLLTWEPAPQHRDGITYDPKADFARLNAQQKACWNVWKCGAWFTLGEVAQRADLQGREASISARFRDFRKMEKAGAPIRCHRRRRGDAKRGTFEYRIEVREERAQVAA